jgi:glycosyltransferase involved in cell wall biosynthesis
MAQNSQSPKKKHSVLMVAPTSFFKDYGGHIRILEEATTLQASGHSITIVTYNMGDDLPDLTIRRTWSLPYHADYEVGSSRHKASFDLYLLAKTIQVGLQLRPDIVHGHMHEGALIGGILARLLRVPLVFDFQGSLTGEMVDHGFLKPQTFAFRLMKRIERAICRFPDAVLTSSLQAEALLTDEFGVDSEDIFPLPDCVDTGRFDPDRFSTVDREELKTQLGIPDGWPVVAYLGLLADYQGTPELIKAAADLKARGENVFFLVMGFPKVDHYRQMAKRLNVGDRMLFTGKVQYRNAARYLSVGDIAASVKMSSSEGSGKVLNYMAMGMPVVAFNTPVHREYLSDLGIYAPVTDVTALATCIESLVHDPDRAKYLGQALRLRAFERFSWKQAGEQIESLYDSLTR